jgi:hypothetical protein
VSWSGSDFSAAAFSLSIVVSPVAEPAAYLIFVSDGTFKQKAQFRENHALLAVDQGTNGSTAFPGARSTNLGKGGESFDRHRNFPRMFCYFFWSSLEFSPSEQTQGGIAFLREAPSLRDDPIAHFRIRGYVL